MTRHYFFSLAIITAALGLLLSPLVPAEAASTAPQDITLSPSSTELSSPPGGTAQGSLSIINSGIAGFTFKAYATPYHVIGLDYDPSFSLIPGKNDPSTWVHFNDATSATIAPGQTTGMTYSLRVPAGTAPGGYYAVIFTETQPAASAGGVSSRSRVGDILYITVQGPVTQSGSIHAPGQSHFVFGTTVPMALEVENNGGLHFVTTTHLALVNYLTNKAVYSASLQHYVLPQTVRRISTVAGPTAIIGLYKVRASADILGQTQTLPNQWVVVVHPVVLWALPAIIVVVVVYLCLPKARPKAKPKPKRKGRK